MLRLHSLWLGVDCSGLVVLLLQDALFWVALLGCC